jgi:hypothetical protein
VGLYRGGTLRPRVRGERGSATSASRSFALRTASITVDLLDPGRVNLFERWEKQAAVDAFRGSGPGNKQGAAMSSVSVAEYDIADVRPLFGEGRA